MGFKCSDMLLTVVLDVNIQFQATAPAAEQSFGNTAVPVQGGPMQAMSAKAPPGCTLRPKPDRSQTEASEDAAAGYW